MKGYIITLLCVCCVAAVIKTASPENATKKYIEMLCAVCVICAVALPAIGIIAEFEGFASIFDENTDTENNYDEIYKQYLNEEGVASAEDVISNSLCRRFGVEDGAIRVVLTLDEDGAAVASATAVIGKGAVDVDPSQVSSHICDTLGVECDIVYELSGE